jgi:predicted ABC-type ATPase
MKIFKILTFMWIIFPGAAFAVPEATLVPNEIVDGFLASYSPEEKVAIDKDYKNIRELCLSQADKEQKKLIYVATAGGPGASKSTILETYLHNNPGFVYVDPDQQALRFMINTYLQEINSYAISKNASYLQLLKDTYGKWRGASNYIANSILNEAYSKNLAIAHGTTSTSKQMGSFYEKLKKRGYKIILFLCASSEKNRLEAIAHREKEQCFIQSTREDLIQKGQMFFENFPIYFKYADEIKFFWIEDFSQSWIEVGSYSRSAGFKKQDKDFEKFKNAYETFSKEHASEHLPNFNDLFPIKPEL